MNPLTLVKRTQQITAKEAQLGISEDASWHAKYKTSAYIFVGGIPYDLTEGDLLAVFAQYGEIVDVNLVRDKATGKPKGYAFVAYHDQRSTNLAVDNFNGAKVLGRIIRVDHVADYKKKQQEEEEEDQQKREERGVCYAFQKGECNRGASCRFSHDEQRNVNTGWGPKDGGEKRDNDKYSGPWKKRTELEEDRQKREERGVCYAFQKGECNRGASCRFSHDETRNANIARGPKDGGGKWDHNKYTTPGRRHTELETSTRSRGKEAYYDDRSSKSRWPDKYDEKSLMRNTSDSRDRASKSERPPTENDQEDHDRYSSKKRTRHRNENAESYSSQQRDKEDAYHGRSANR